MSRATAAPILGRPDEWAAALVGTGVFVVLAHLIAPWLDLLWSSGVVFLMALGFAHQNRGIKDSISLVGFLVAVSVLLIITDIYWRDVGDIVISVGVGISIASFGVSISRIVRKPEG